MKEWNRLSTEIRNSNSCQEFRKPLSSFIILTCSSLFSIHHSVSVKLLVRLRLGFSHLREHKFRHNFHDTLNPSCSCSLEPETTLHYLLCWHNFSSTRLALMNDFRKSTSENTKILQRTIKYIIATKRFDESFFQRSHLHARFIFNKLLNTYLFTFRENLY